MQQTEQEYIRTLRDRLTGHVSQEDLDEILSDYAEHFSIGKSEGRSEQELCTALGTPEDVAREILASYLVTKAEQARSAGNIWHAVMATLGLGLFNLICVLIPFVLLIALLVIIFIAGMVMLVSGPIMLLIAVMQLIGFTIPVSWWSSPVMGIFISIGLCIAGIILVILDFHLARYFYRIAIRYLKWNIRVIRGGDGPDQDEAPCPSSSTVPRDGAESLDLQVLFGAGDLSIGEGSGGRNLVDLTTRDGTPCAPLSVTSSLSGSRRQVRIRGRHGLSPWWCDEHSPVREIGISPEVPVGLDLRNKAGRTILALGALNLTSLRIRNGAGETRVDLAGYHGGGFDAQIRNGVGHLAIRLPKEYRLQIRVHRGIGDTDVRGLFVDGDMYLTRPDRPDAPQITFFVKQGVGSLSLEAV